MNAACDQGSGATSETRIVTPFLENLEHLPLGSDNAQCTMHNVHDTSSQPTTISPGT